MATDPRLEFGHLRGLPGTWDPTRLERTEGVYEGGFTFGNAEEPGYSLVNEWIAGPSAQGNPARAEILAAPGLKFSPTQGWMLPTATLQGITARYPSGGDFLTKAMSRFNSPLVPLALAAGPALGLWGGAGVGAEAGSAFNAAKLASGGINGTEALIGGGAGAGAGAGSGALSAADTAGLYQMAADAGLTGPAADAFVASGGTMGSTIAGGGGIGTAALSAADKAGLRQMAIDAGLKGADVDAFVASGGKMGSTASGAGFGTKAAGAFVDKAIDALISGGVNLVAGAISGEAGRGATEAGERASQASEEAMRAASDLMREQAGMAREQYDFYKKTFQPLETALVGEATKYGSQEDQERVAGEAHADVTQAFARTRDAARRNALAYGINPASGRFADQELRFGLDQAKADVLAQNLARKGVRDTGFFYRQNAAALGRNLPSLAATGIAGASGSALNTARTGTLIGATDFERGQLLSEQARQGWAPITSVVAEGIKKWLRTPDFNPGAQWA